MSFAFGTRLDLGWIMGYLVVMLAALHPSEAPSTTPAEPPSDTRGAVLVFAVVLLSPASSR